MRLVIDTNVIVSALLNPDRTPARALHAVRERGLTVVVDERIEAEYRSVLSRKKFASIDPARREALLEGLLGAATRVEATPIDLAMIDPDDRVFVEVARTGGADAIVTGNGKHFPDEVGVLVLSPAALLESLSA